MTTTQHRRLGALALASTVGLLLSACATTTSEPGASPAQEPELPRLAVTYDGGILVLDSATLDIEADLSIDGFTRVNAAGDGRHVLVTTPEGFRVLDTGARTDDASDTRTGEPALTDLVFEATEAGHVVRHAGKTILFADGTGDTTIFDSSALADSTGALPETETIASEAAHHGVAIELADGSLLSTLGTSETRTGVRVLDADREEIARSEDCPSVHGEGAASGERAVFGCSDGVLVYDDGEFTKIQAEDEYGRTGNQYTTDTSTITVGDYNSDPDSESYLLNELLITDTVAKSSTVVDLPSDVGYTWRGVARDADDGAWVLGSDGALHELELPSGELGRSIDVIDAWEGPTEWQDAHPALTIIGSTAFVTDPATQSVHSIDLASGDLTSSDNLPGAPIELALALG